MHSIIHKSQCIAYAYRHIQRSDTGVYQYFIMMKRYFFAIYFLCTVCAIAVAQPRISSNKTTHNFGQIEWKKPVKVEFVITNTGDKPLVLNNVTTSCACSVADWVKSPIAPGKEGVISATFDAKALGHFHKSIGVYSNATPELIYFNFNGEVVQEVTDLIDYDLESIGQIMIDQTEIDFPDAHIGERPVMRITVVNQSSGPYEPVLMHLPPYLIMTKEPEVLQRGEKGVITLTLDTDRLPELGLTQTSVYLSRFVGDKVNDENEIPVSAVLLPDFSGMSENERANAPAINLSRTDVDLSGQLSKKNKATYDITVSNMGKSPLHINKLQVFNPAVGVSLRKSVLAPREQTRLRITLDKRNLKKKKQLRILLISNDPIHPKSIIKLNID